MTRTQPELIGGFILLPSGQQALNIEHVTVLHVTGREDPDHPRAKNVQLVADQESADGSAAHVLGFFTTFREAETALAGLLERIARGTVIYAEAAR